MEKRIERINKIKNRFLQGASVISKNEVCKELGISIVTLARYINHLKKSGANIISKGDIYELVGGSFETQEGIFSKSGFVSLKVLMYIFNNNPCNRKKIQNFFCRKSDDGLRNEKMTVRNLDIHLNKLLNQKLIEKFRDNGTLYYRTSGRTTPLNDLTIDQYVSIINYLKLSKPFLPFSEAVDSIISKLMSSITSYIGKVAELCNDIGLSDMVVPVGPDRYGADIEEDVIYKLGRYCRRNVLIKIRMDNDNEIDVFPLCVIYNWKNGNWYLAFRKTRARKGFELVRVEKIKDILYIGKNNSFTEEETAKEKEKIEEKLNKGLGMAFGKKFKVEAVFLNHFNVIDKAKKDLAGVAGSGKALPDGSYYFSGEMEGAMDFLAWLRRFGSSVVIISPEWLRYKHIESAQKVLKNYGVDYETAMS